MRQCGANSIAQDEASSIVFGMPNKAIERGAAEKIVFLSEVTRAMTGFARCLERKKFVLKEMVIFKAKDIMKRDVITIKG